MKYADVKIFAICVDLYTIYAGDKYDKLYEVLSTLKNKKLKINNIIIEIYKDMLSSPDSEQNYWSRTARGISKIAHNSIKLKKWICYYDRYFMKILIIMIYWEVFVDITLISHNCSYTNIEYYYKCLNKLTYI